MNERIIAHLHKLRHSWGLLLLPLLILTACSGEILRPPQVLENLSTPTPRPTSTAEPPPAVIPGGAEGIGLAFFRAWEGQDYLGMYSLLSPQSQALVDSRSFISLYEQAMNTAVVKSIHAQPLASRQEGDRTEFSARVTWKTAVVGDFSRDYLMTLVYSDGRWGVVWNESLILPELEGGQKLHLEYRIPGRANIYDINGRALAYQGTAVTLGVIPGRIEDEPALLDALSLLFNRTPQEIKAIYAPAMPDWYWPIGDVAGDLLQEYAAQIQPHIGRGLTANERLTRLYTPEGIAAHVVGYTGAISAERAASYRSEGYRGDEQVGLTGIELWGESYLRGGRGGRLSIVGPSGEFMRTVQETDARQARSLYTTFEWDFQWAVEQALAEAIRSHPLAAAGSIVVVDVNNGAVLAMASYPTFNPAVFDPLRAGSEANLTAVLNDPGRPLLNRAAQSAYPTGSIFKIVTMAAGLNSGLYTPDTRYTSTGSWNRLGDAFIKYDWREGGHGTVSLRQAITVSCNSCFYDVGLNVHNQDRDLLPATARQFGLGSPTGIQGINESPGLIPDNAWKLATYGEGWSPGDAVNMSIGQGFMLATPLQMANIFAAIANGGTFYQPTLINRIGAGGGAPEEIWPTVSGGEIPMSAEHLQALRQGLWDVTNGGWGTATFQFEGFPIPVAGKTGTAETNARPHAWFGGYAPAAPYTLANGTVISDPEIAVLVMIEHAGEGSEVAAPVFRRIIELYYGVTPVRPFPWQ